MEPAYFEGENMLYKRLMLCIVFISTMYAFTPKPYAICYEIQATQKNSSAVLEITRSLQQEYNSSKRQYIQLHKRTQFVLEVVIYDRGGERQLSQEGRRICNKLLQQLHSVIDDPKQIYVKWEQKHSPFTPIIAITLPMFTFLLLFWCCMQFFRYWKKIKRTSL